MRNVYKITALTLALMIALLSFVGCDLFKSEPAEKTFDVGGIKITLDDTYTSTVSNDSGNVTFISSDSGCAIVAKKEAFSRLEELKYKIDEVNAKKYAEIIVKDNKIETQIVEDGQLVYFEHTVTNTGDSGVFKYFTAVYKSTEAFWTVYFGCNAEAYDTNRANFVRFANTVLF